MGSIWVTGDTHGDYSRFCKAPFPIQNEMTRDDYIIICGDFGIWDDSKSQQYKLDELDARNFTTLFVDGNHENYDMLCTEQYKKFMRGESWEDADCGDFPIIPKFGGYVQQVRPNIFHLMRGEVYEIHGKKIFVFGGAASHDIRDGILDRDNFATDDEFYEMCYQYRRTAREYRIAHMDWWKEEIPNQDEMRHGMESLAKHDFKVDYIFSHCAPTSTCYLMGYRGHDNATDYLQKVYEKTAFGKWYFGHYHRDISLNLEMHLMYHSIIPIFDTEKPSF